MKNAAILCGYTGKQSWESTSCVGVSVAMFRVLLSNHGRQWGCTETDEATQEVDFNMFGCHFMSCYALRVKLPRLWDQNASWDYLLAALHHIERTPESCSEAKTLIHANIPLPRLMKTLAVSIITSSLHWNKSGCVTKQWTMDNWW